MKTTIKILLFMAIIIAVNISPINSQVIDTTWVTRTDFITPAGYTDSSNVKEVYLLVNLPFATEANYVEVRIGSSEGGSDLFSVEVTCQNGQNNPIGNLTSEGLLRILAGQFSIDPEAFFIETRLYNAQNEQINP